MDHLVWSFPEYFSRSIDLKVKFVANHIAQVWDLNQNLDLKYFLENSVPTFEREARTSNLAQKEYSNSSQF